MAAWSVGAERWNKSVPSRLLPWTQESGLPAPLPAPFQESRRKASRFPGARIPSLQPFLPQTQESWLPAPSSLRLGFRDLDPLFPQAQRSRAPASSFPRIWRYWCPPRLSFPALWCPASVLPRTQESRTLQPLTSPSPQRAFSWARTSGVVSAISPLGHAHFPRRGSALSSLIGPRWLQVSGPCLAAPPLVEVAGLFSKAEPPFSEALPFDATYPAF